MHEDAGGVGRGGRARVVARVLGLRARDEQRGGPRLLVRHHRDAAALRIVDHVGPAVPVDEGWRVRRGHHLARQVDV